MSSHRKGLTFAQAEGVEPLPQQLKLREVSQECSAALWAIVHDSFQKDHYSDGMGYGGGSYLTGAWRTIMEVWHVTREHKYVDEFNIDYAQRQSHLKAIITSKDYLIVFEFIQFLIQRPDCPYRLAAGLGIVLERTRSAYRIVDDLVVPISTDEEAEAITLALDAAASAKARGPQAHLRNAANQLTSGQWAASIRESISAVEGAAKSIEPSASTLGPALAKLQSSIGLAPEMKKAFGSLYGYASSGNGVRHALVFEGESDVTERDALFMFGACAAFVGYLLNANAAH